MGNHVIFQLSKCKTTGLGYILLVVCKFATVVSIMGRGEGGTLLILKIRSKYNFFLAENMRLVVLCERIIYSWLSLFYMGGPACIKD